MRINDVEFNSSLQEILDELVSQLRANGIPLIQKQKEGPTHIQICCPYHNGGMENRPSAGLRKSDGAFHCFACGEVHSLPEVITHCFGHYDDILGKFGWNWLLKNFAVIEQEERKDVELDLARNGIVSRGNVVTKSSDNMGSDYVSEEELDSYRYYHPYWHKRGITDDNIIELFDLGYDKQTQCITFPIRDIYGHTLFVARRSVYTKYFNYPQGVEKPLYGLYEIYEELRLIEREYDTLDYELRMEEIIVCESMIDALTCWQYGKYAVALNGLGNDLQFKQLKELPCRKLILATDNDEAGMKARERIRKNVPNKIITEYMLPEGKKDINELTQEEFENLEEVF